MSRLYIEVRSLLVMAWPVALAQVASLSMATTDVIMVGHYDGTQLAGVAIAAAWNFSVVVFGIGVLSALDPVFSQAHGARDARSVGRALRHGLVLAACLALPTTGAVWLGEYGLALLGQPDELLPIAGTYLRIVGTAAPVGLVWFVLKQCLQGQAISWPTTLTILAANLLNIAADWVLVFGHFGFPAMGAAGAAWATLMCSYFQAALLLAIAWPRFAASWLASVGSFHVAGVAMLARLGLPLGLQFGTEVWAFNTAAMMAGWLGTTSLSANSVILNAASMSFMLPLGVSVAASTRVGNRIGAGEPWGLSAGAALLVGAGVMCSSGLVFALFPLQLASIYTDDASVAAVAAGIFPIAAAFQLFDGIQVVAFGVLRGAGDTRMPSVANLVGYWLLGLPLGAFLAFRLEWGLAGLWIGLATALATVATLLAFRVRALVRRSVG